MTNKPSLFRVSDKNYVIPFILLTTLFLMWGLANNMTDTLLAAFKKIMSMSDFQTSWIQLAFYGSYFCLAIPAALFIKRFNYKSGVLLGLGLFILGSISFYPASITQVYGHFLLALFVLAGGLSILETSANSYIIFLGPEETATRRLNLAQSFNPIGSILGVILSKYFILSSLHQADTNTRMQMSSDQLEQIQTEELNAVMGPYVGIAVVLLLIWLLIAIYRMPRASDGTQLNFISTIKKLIKNRNYVSGVMAQFFYVGAQIGVWSFTIRYVMLELSVNEEKASSYYIAALVAFTLSRFVFTGLMKFFKPGALLAFAALAAMVCSIVVILGSGIFAVIALVAISAFMSLMFPTIFGQAVRGLGSDTKVGGSGLIMAILGGAVLTAIQGLISDATGNIHYSYIVPLICFMVIFAYGIRSDKFKITLNTSI
jgi:FHS family L-fucose permease-like MFS transporter